MLTLIIYFVLVTMMMVGSSENDEDFNEDIYCDSCHQMWPEIVYIEHWEMCKSSKTSKREQQAEVYLRDQELKLQFKKRKSKEEKSKKYKQNGRRKYEMDGQTSDDESQQLPGRINKYKKETAHPISSPLPQLQQRKTELERNDERIRCNGCGKSMKLREYEVHPALCEYPTVQCPYCRMQIAEQLIPMHSMNCPMNTGSQAIENSSRSLPFPLQAVIQQCSFGNQLSEQALEHQQTLLWSEAKNKDKGLKEEQVQLFDILKYKRKTSQPDSKICTVCFDELEDGADYIQLPCNHVFHPPCITPWIKKKAECPNCKFNIKENFVQCKQ